MGWEDYKELIGLVSMINQPICRQKCQFITIG